MHCFLHANHIVVHFLFGGFMIIYSITQDMTRLASAMDPRMGSNMSSMVISIDNRS
jgi:hypothetical protein